MDNISLETSVHWPSEEMVGSRSKLGLHEICKKCINNFTQKSCQAATTSSNLLRDVNIAMETIAWPLNVRSQFQTFQSLVTSVLGYVLNLYRKHACGHDHITAVRRRIGPVAVADNDNIFAVFTIVHAHSL